MSSIMCPLISGLAISGHMILLINLSSFLVDFLFHIMTFSVVHWDT